MIRVSFSTTRAAGSGDLVGEDADQHDGAPAADGADRGGDRLRPRDAVEGARRSPAAAPSTSSGGERGQAERGDHLAALGLRLGDDDLGAAAVRRRARRRARSRRRRRPGPWRRRRRLGRGGRRARRRPAARSAPPARAGASAGSGSALAARTTIDSAKPPGRVGVAAVDAAVRAEVRFARRGRARIRRSRRSGRPRPPGRARAPRRRRPPRRRLPTASCPITSVVARAEEFVAAFVAQACSRRGRSGRCPTESIRSRTSPGPACGVSTSSTLSRLLPW